MRNKRRDEQKAETLERLEELVEMGIVESTVVDGERVYHLADPATVAAIAKRIIEGGGDDGGSGSPA